MIYESKYGSFFIGVINSLRNLNNFPINIGEVSEKGLAFPIRLDKNINLEERSLIYLHEIHHEVLDKSISWMLQDSLNHFFRGISF
ncbi:MAG: hypothetical protein U9Q99_00830 [Nanoarchaeota archaeon]|nr:hypothetical protein [Nanoarchaeota archaeon]